MSTVEKQTTYTITVNAEELAAIVEGLGCVAGLRSPEEREVYDRLAEQLAAHVEAQR